MSLSAGPSDLIPHGIFEITALTNRPFRYHPFGVLLPMTNMRPQINYFRAVLPSLFLRTKVGAKSVQSR